MRPTPDTDALHRLADVVGVATHYQASGATHTTPDATLRAVLTALGHPCGDGSETRRSLRAARRAPWLRMIDPVAVVWRADEGRSAGVRVTVSAADPGGVALRLLLEDGGTRALGAVAWGGVAETSAGRRRRGSVGIPADLPTGYHRLEITGDDRSDHCTVIVAPARTASGDGRRRWGWMLQAYAVRSADSWGQGEFADLGRLARWGAAHGADFLVINPLHAPDPVLPQQPSPYSPTSRRFLNPCYLHVPAIARAALDGWSGPALPAALDARADRIDRDAIWRTKRDALWDVFTASDALADGELERFRENGGVALQRFAVYCAIAEVEGAGFTSWPSELRDPRSEAVGRWAADHEDRVAFHAWLQLHCRRQLAAAQRRARDAGMTIGIVGDLAVGVAPGGADVWSLPDEFARTTRVGAPPDAFNQQGQDWGTPPPLPDAMRRTGYRAQREVIAGAIAGGGGLRIDHILGFSRLFWIPQDAAPSDGTYVRYPADELFAVLMVEAERANAVIVGEDLGTVDRHIRALMRARGVAGSAVLWFETDDRTTHGRRRQADYPRSALASVTTHDLPTATGWWDGSALQTRVDLGLLDRPAAVERAEHAADVRSMEALLREAGLLDATIDAGDVRARVVAMHAFLGGSPAVLVAATVWDGVGDPRQPNVPGTIDAYPNWRLPLAVATPDGPRPVTVEDLVTGSATDDVVAALRAARG